ncbi:MAG: hypothetical protein ACQERB_16570, partial [Promethearchaeati archaeon]
DIKLPNRINGIEELTSYLHAYDVEILKVIAGFNKNFLNYFLEHIVNKDEENFTELIKKLEKMSYLSGPMGNLTYLTSNQVDYVLTKINQLELKEINEENISLIADEQLQKEFGREIPQYSRAQMLENQISSARFYLNEIGYTSEEINKKIEEVREDPSKLDDLFNLPPKEIYNLPEELGHIGSDPETSSNQASDENINIIESHIQSIQREIGEERAKQVNEILSKIQDHVRDKMTENYKRVYKQMHPDRLRRAYRFLRDTKRKDNRMDLYLDWFFSTHLLENIELKVEHWQVSSQATHGNVGVYTAGTSFSRYDPIIKDFSDSKLSKVIKIARKILQNPTKRRIQKLGQDLIAETGFDEHLYFTD